MALVVTPFGDNQYYPLSTAETYVPDQLVAGNLKLVTDTVTIYGSAVFQRGTVMGLGYYAGSQPTTSTGKTPASATVTFTNQPVAGDTVTVGGTVLTFATAGVEPVAPPALTVFIGGTTAQTANNFAGAIIGSTDTNLVKLSAAVTSSNVVTLTTLAYGTGGNSTTLATSDATNITVSGATFSGGTANAGTATIGSVTAGPQAIAGTYKVVLTAATTGTLFDPRGEQIGATSAVTMGSAFTSSQVNFTITTGGSPAAGDAFTITLDPDGYAFTICNAAATDGSAVPAAILADLIDCTGGNVTGPVYLMGEFNVNALTFGPGINAINAKAALLGKGIFLKGAVNAADPS